MNNKLINSNNTWEYLGSHDPYWAVISEKSKYNNQWDKSEFYNTATPVSNILSQITSVRDIQSIKFCLDFGCGVGRLTKPLSKIFPYLIGIDISNSMLTAALKNSFSENTLYIQNIDKKLPFIKDCSIDLIISLLTFQHIPNVFKPTYISEFARVLRNGGTLVVQLPVSYTFSMKGIIYFIFRNRIINLGKRLFFGNPVWPEMYCISKTKLFKLFSNNKLKLFNIIKDDSCGVSFNSFTFYLSKTDE